MKTFIALMMMFFLAACSGAERADNDGDTLSSVRRDVDTVVDRVTDKVDSVTEAILDSARSKGPKLIKKGEKAIKDVLE